MDSKRLLQLLSKVILSCVVMFAFAGTAFAQSTYYVSASSGNNSFNGSQANVGTFPNGPFRTIGQAMTVVSDGDTVVIEAGTYSEDVTFDDDINVQTTASGANVTVTVGDGAGSAITMDGTADPSVIFAGGGAAITFPAAQALDLNGGTLTLASGALRIPSGGTILRSEGSLAGVAPTFGSNTNVTYDDATGTPAVTAGLELPADMGSGDLTVSQGGGSLTVPGGLEVDAVVHSGGADLTFQAAVVADGVVSSTGSGDLAFDGGLDSAEDSNPSIDINDGEFTAASVTLDDLGGIDIAAGETGTISGTLTIEVDVDNAAVTPVVNNGTLTVGTVAFSYVDIELQSDSNDLDNVLTIDNNGDFNVTAGWTEAGNASATVDFTGSFSTGNGNITTEVNVSNDGAGSRFTFTPSVAISGSLTNSVATPDGVHFNGGGSVAGDINNTGTVTIATGQTLTASLATAFTSLADFNGAGTLVISAGGDIPASGLDSDGGVTINAATGVTNNMGPATVDGTFTINNDGTHTGAVIVGGNLSVTADPVDFLAAVTVAGDATLDASGTGDGPDFAGALSVTGTANFNDDTDVGGNFTAGTANVNDSLTLSSAAGTHNLATALNVTGTMSLAAGASGITSDLTTIDPNGSFTLGAGNTFTSEGNLTGGLFDGTGAGSGLIFSLPSGGATFSPGPNTAVNNFTVTGNELTLTLVQGFEVQNDLTVSDDATLDLTNELIRLTAAGAGNTAATVSVDTDAMVVAQSNSGALSFEGDTGDVFTVSSPGATIGTLTNIIVSSEGTGAAGDVVFDDPVTITGVVSLVEGGITLGANTMTFSGDAAGVSVNVAGTATAITGTTAGVYDLSYSGAGPATAGPEYADPGTNVIDDLTINTTGGALTLGGTVGINGNLSVGSSSTVTVGTGLIVGGNATVSATDASDGTLGGGTVTLVGDDATHTFAGLVTSDLVFDGNSTVVGDTDGDRASSLTNVLVDDGETVAMSGIQEILGNLIVEGMLSLSLSDSDGTGTDDQDIEGDVFIDEGGTLTLNSSITVLGGGALTEPLTTGPVGFMVGNSGSGGASLDLNGNTLFLDDKSATTYNAHFYADADANLGSTGTIVLDDVGTGGLLQRWGTNGTAVIPNLNIDVAGTSLFYGSAIVTNLDVDEDFEISTNSLFVRGDATFTSAAAPVAITGTSGQFVVDGTGAQTFTMSQNVEVPNFFLNSEGSLALATSSTTGTNYDFVVVDADAFSGEAQFNQGTLALGSQDFVLRSDAASGEESLFDYNGGTITSSGGWFVVNDDSDALGGADFDLAGAPGAVSIPNLRVDIGGAAAADGDDGLDLGGTDVLTVTSSFNLEGGTVFTDDGSNDASVSISGGARIIRDLGVFEQTPTFGTGISVEYDGAVTTARELPGTVNELQIDAAVTFANGKAVTASLIDLNALLTIDDGVGTGSESLTLIADGTVQVSVSAPIATGAGGAGSDDGEFVYAGAFNILYDALAGAVTTDGVVWNGTPASVTVNDGDATSSVLTVTLGGNKSAVDVAVEGDDALALGGFTLTTTGNISGGSAISGGSVAFAGTTAQTIAGPVTLPGVVVNNAAGVTLTGGNMTVTGTLTLTEGILDTGSNWVMIPHGGTAAQGFARTSGFVKGTVRKQIQGMTTVADRMVFPVGINPYRPMAITFNNPAQISGAAASGIFLDVSHVGASPGGNNNMPLTTVDGDGADLRVARYPDFYWNVTSSSSLSPSVSYDVELDAGDYASFVGEDIERTRTIRRQAGATTNFWTLVGGGVAANNDNYAASSTNPVTVVRNAVGALISTPGVIFTMGLQSNLGAGSIAAVNVNAGATADVDLSTVFTGGTAPFTYTVASSDAAVATGAASGSTLTVTGVSAGSATLTVSAIDALNDTIVATAAVTVNGALAASPSNTDVVLNAGSSATFDLSTIFVGGAAPITYGVATSDAAIATGAEASGTLTITAVANGAATVTVTGTDATGATASATFTTSVNSAMAAAGTLADISVTQGTATDVDASGEFSGGDGTYTYEATAGSADATASVATDGTVTVTGVNPYTGTGDDAVDTAPVIITVTATDGIGSSVSSTFAADVAAIKGNVAGLGGPDPVSASLTLDGFLGLATLTAKQTAAADYNGDSSVTPFDAAQIFDAWLNPAAAAKVEMVANPASDMGFGEVDRVTNTVAIPVVVTGDVASAVAFSFETAIDPSVGSVAGITTAEGWTIRYVTEEDGTVRIAGFGLEALPSGGVIATINLDLKDAGAAFTLKAQGAVNNNPATEIEGVEVVELPDNFALLGNYPNPFNPSTNISFDLPASADVAIEVYDMLGRRVMVLPAQTIQAGSKRSVQLNASQLASGSYFYRVIATMESKTQVDQGRMLLVK